VSVFDLSSVTYFPACTDVNGTVQPNCADVKNLFTHLSNLSAIVQHGHGVVRHCLW